MPVLGTERVGCHAPQPATRGRDTSRIERSVLGEECVQRVARPCDWAHAWRMQPGEHDPPSPRRTAYQHAAGDAKLVPESGKAVAILLAELADLRERIADDRERTADARDRAADSRDCAADARDEAADAREALADQREQVASAREALLERLFRTRGLAFRRLHGGEEEAAARSSDSRARRMAVSGRMEATRQRDQAARKRDAASRRRQTARMTREHLVLGGEMADTMERLRRQQQEALARARIATARARSLRDSARAARAFP